MKDPTYEISTSAASYGDDVSAEEAVIIARNLLLIFRAHIAASECTRRWTPRFVDGPANAGLDASEAADTERQAIDRLFQVSCEDQVVLHPHLDAERWIAEYAGRCDAYGFPLPDLETPEEARIARIAEDAQDAFWAVVAERYPNNEGGDFPADAHFAFERACQAAVRAWAESNVPRFKARFTRAEG